MKTTLLNGWQEVSLSDILAEIENGSRPKGGIKETSQGVPSLGGEHLDSKGGFNFKNIRLIPEIFYKKLKRGKIKKYDVLVVKDGATTGKVSIVDDDFPYTDASINEHLFILRGKKNILEQKFLFYHLFSSLGQEQIKKSFHGSAIGGINTQFVKNYSLLLPPLEIQKKIVLSLKKAEKVKDLREEIDELTKDFLKAVFLEMFSKGFRKESDHVLLEDVTTRITDGEHITPRRADKGIYLLSARNILNHQISLKDVDFIDEKEFQKISKRIEPQFGDILVSCSGSVGRVTRVKDDYRFQLVRSVALIRPDTRKLNPIYLEYFFESNYMQMQIAKSINQSSQANLFQGKIKKLKIYLPPLEIQNKFSVIVKQIEKIKEYQKISKDNIENLFKNLIQQAFRGELTC